MTRLGLMQVLEIVKPGSDTMKDAARTAALRNEARKYGLLIGKGGLYGKVPRISPHLNVTREDVRERCARLAKSMAGVA
jgi:4-aminobutyrate aminotransferase